MRDRSLKHAPPQKNSAAIACIKGTSLCGVDIPDKGAVLDGYVCAKHDDGATLHLEQMVRNRIKAR